MKAPQLIFASLYVISVVWSLANDGEPKGKYSFWETLFGTMIGVGILHWGGFWN